MHHSENIVKINLIDFFFKSTNLDCNLFWSMSFLSLLLYFHRISLTAHLLNIPSHATITSLLSTFLFTIFIFESARLYMIVKKIHIETFYKNYIIVKNIRIWYFENTHRDESNNILYANIYFYLSVKNYSQNNMCE
jgi:hypothetical protein